MLAKDIKTASELRMFIEEAGHAPHFFDRNTMRCFGDTMKNYGVRRAVIKCNFNLDGLYCEEGHDTEVFELYRRRPVKGGNQGSAYFCPVTFKRVHAKV